MRNDNRIRHTVLLNDFILAKHFHLNRVTQLKIFSSSSFACRSASSKFFASINSTGNGHFKKKNRLEKYHFVDRRKFVRRSSYENSWCIYFSWIEFTSRNVRNNLSERTADGCCRSEMRIHQVRKNRIYWYFLVAL